MLSRVSILICHQRGLGGHSWASGQWWIVLFTGECPFQECVDPVAGGSGGHTRLPGCGHTVHSRGLFPPAPLAFHLNPRSSSLRLPRQKQSVSGRMLLERSCDGRPQSPVLSCDILAPWPPDPRTGNEGTHLWWSLLSCTTSGKQGKVTNRASLR